MVRIVFFVDVPKVRGKMAEHGYTLTALSAELGINRNTLAAYLEAPGRIPYDVMARMATLLCDSNTAEASAIFFAQDLRKTKVRHRG